MKGMVLGDKGAVDQFANHLGRGWWINFVKIIEYFGCCHVVRCGAHAADARRDLWHFFSGAPLHELLKPPKFGYLKIGALHGSRIVQKNLDFAMPFKASDGINRDVRSHGDIACLRVSSLGDAGWCFLV